MNKKSNNEINRPLDYETKFKNLILDYLRKKKHLVNIPELEKNLKNEKGTLIPRQTLRYNLRILGISEKINFYIRFNPVKGYQIPRADEVFIGLPVSSSSIYEHPNLLLNLINRMKPADQNYIDFKQLFISRAKENLRIKLEQYKNYLREDHKYSEKDIKKHLKIYMKKNDKTALKNAEEEANRLANFLITEATNNFKKKVANQLTFKDKSGKYDLNFEYKI